MLLNISYTFYYRFAAASVLAQMMCTCIVGIFFSCNNSSSLFEQVAASHSGILFNNKITENDSMNIIDLENIYNGGGVGIGDFNNDGLQDIYFTGNMVANKLYINKGDLKFEDATSAAGAEGEGKWSRGVSVVDINNDGWQDIYIAETILKDSVKRENILYINQGVNKDGIPVFKDMAAAYGLNDNSYTTQAAFFDYDNDGDLDVYLAVNVFAQHDNPNLFRKQFLNGEHPNTDRLYRNDWDSAKGHPVFTNVSRQAGILQEGYAHSVTVCDINKDGWKDVFVANDYLSEDILYINNGNGSFSNQSKKYFKHTAYNAMGADVVDINNDGLSDVIELDMNPEDNYRKKTMLGGGNYQAYLYSNEYHYQYQYVRNGLQLNMGNVCDSSHHEHPVFGDISFYSGIAETDWSWMPLVADFDNDGFRDIIITNGFPKDVTDHDFMAYRNSAFGMNDKQKLLAIIPEIKISNYAYRNGGGLKFEDVTKAWGLYLPTFSNGAATADLDNDGDLDVIINNINDEALLYENKANEKKNKQHHYIKVKLEGLYPNKGAFGSWVKIFYDHGKTQVYETNPVRGYLSSVESMAFFGLDSVDVIDSLQIIWANNTFQTFMNVQPDQQFVVKQSPADKKYIWQQSEIESNPLFTEASDSLNLKYVQEQKDFNDFSVQKLLPHKLSQYSPPMAAGDINNDGTEDLVIGGADGKSETIFFQKSNGIFERKELINFTTAISSFAIDLQLFDADNDKDLDLYVASGGYEDKAGSAAYQDKLYINDGKGNFSLDSTALPVNRTSKSCVQAVDYDKDGDIDIFIGGRVEPWQYPKHVSSIILRNDSKAGNIKFTDVTKDIAPGLENIGLICDALCTDYNNDGWTDLILAGEWMPLTFFKNEKGKLVNETAASGLAEKTGWWNCLAAGDFDRDGDTDFVAGNTGENSFFSNNDRHPINSYFNDFDKNGTFETVTTKYLKDKDGAYKEYTAASRDEVVDQMPFIKKKFLTYKSFATADAEDIFGKDALQKSLKLHAGYFASSYVQNLGNGKFSITPLPAMAQLAPVCAISVADFDNDNKLDVMIAGNNYGAEVFNGRMDAMNGMLLKGNGKGHFTLLPPESSGIYLPGQVNAVTIIKNIFGDLLFAACENNSALKLYVKNKINKDK